MPSLRLSLELELYIIDLAIPPRTFHDTVERIQLCKTLALVYRDWIARAQQHLAQHAILELPGFEDELDRRLKGLEIAFSSSQTATHLDLWVQLATAISYDLKAKMSTCLAKLEELILKNHYLAGAPSRHGINSHCPLITIPPSGVRFLSIALFTLSSEDVEQIVRLPHLETLLLTAVRYRDDYHAFKTFLASHVRILGFRGLLTDMLDVVRLETASPSIQHVGLLGFEVYSYEWMHIRPPRLASTRRTLSIVLPPAGPTSDETRIHEYDADLTSAAQAAGVRLKIQHCTSRDEIHNLNLEEWAMPVDLL
ncbi:hypothetical protein JCM10296v2_005762 [Rhodotorula toruloides]